MFDIDDFARNGIAHFPGAFDPEEAGAMRSVIWRYIEGRSTIREADPSTWPPRRLPPGLSLKSLKGRGVFAPFARNDALQKSLTVIFGSDDRIIPKRGARFLITFPSPGPWVMPKEWHIDTGFDRPTFPVPWVQLWAFMAEVGPCGGGTLVLAGSHRVVERYSRDLPDSHRPGNGVNWTRFMRQHPVLEQLHKASETDPGRDLLGVEGDVDGIPVTPVELTGRPGDLFITHGQVFHCVSPNTTASVRMMLTGAIYRAAKRLEGPVPELALLAAVHPAVERFTRCS